MRIFAVPLACMRKLINGQDHLFTAYGKERMFFAKLQERDFHAPYVRCI